MSKSKQKLSFIKILFSIIIGIVFGFVSTPMIALFAPPYCWDLWGGVLIEDNILCDLKVLGGFVVGFGFGYFAGGKLYTNMKSYIKQTYSK